MKSIPAPAVAALIKKLTLCFASSFGAVFVLLLANQILLLRNSFAGRHPAASEIALLAFLSLPTVIVLSIPFGVCTGFFRGFFGTDAAAGIAGTGKENIFRLILPVFCAGFVLSAAGFMVYDGILPKTNKSFLALHNSVSREESWLLANPHARQAGTMNSGGILQEIKRIRNGGEVFQGHELNLYEMEFHKRCAIPLGALCYAFFALSLSLVWKKKILTGILVSAGVWVLDWGLSIGGQYLALRLGKFGAQAVWLPNIALLGASALLYLHFAKTQDRKKLPAAEKTA